MTEHHPTEPESALLGSQTLWHGRFDAGPAAELLAFTESLSFDRRLWPDDIAGSRAHVAGLLRSKLISEADHVAIIAALDQVADELQSATFNFVETDEDIHTAIERRVTEIAGAAGGKMHTGRSRNDQIATDVRLWMKRELVQVASRIVALQRVLLDRAIEAGDSYLPGYTHLQRAQPVLLAHHLLAHGWALGRDVDRLRDTMARVDISPLGAGALAGSSLPLEPSFTAGELGFAGVFTNSLDAIGSRDHVAEAMFDLAMVAVNLSRLGEEWVLWTSEEFGFATLDDAHSTGSSMMPQKKKNPDIAELARGKAGRLIGNLTGLLATMKGLPLSYNRDYQEDKEPLFDAVDQVRLALGALSGMIATATFKTATMQSAADSETGSATDLAEWLVVEGMPFREAHTIVGALVRQALTQPASLRDLVAAHPNLGPRAAALVAPGVSVTRRTTPGGAGPVPVAHQIVQFRRALEVWSAWATTGTPNTA